MAAATAMDIHDRRLSTNKSSAKIKKTTASSSSASSSSATSAPSRPVAKVVNADPSSFRRVVQELTGTPSPSPSSASSSPSRSSSSPSSSLHHPSPSSCTTPAAPVRASRLQRCAPPPLRPDFKNLSHVGLVMNGVHQGFNGVNPAVGGVNQGFNGVNQGMSGANQGGMNGVNLGFNGVHQGMNGVSQGLHGVNQGIVNESIHGNINAINSQHHLSRLLLLQQQQQQQPQELQLKQREQQQHPPLPPPPSMVRAPPPLSPTLLGAANLSSASHMSQDARLPMLSPHLLSPLPALTPGDNAWASPLDVISGAVSPGSMAAAPASTSSLPSLLPLPSLPNGNASMHGRPSVQSQLASQPVLQQQQQQPQNLPLPPLLPSPGLPQFPVSPSGIPFAWPPYSPTFLPLPPFSPNFLPPSPGSSLAGGAPAAMAAFSSPRDFSFRGINDYSMFRPT